jgi:excisionase family DNA binding protein
MDAADDGWLSVQHAAQVLGVVPRTVYRLINDGQRRGYRIGRVVRVRSEDLERYLDSARIVPGSLDHLGKAAVVGLAIDPVTQLGSVVRSGRWSSIRPRPHWPHAAGLGTVLAIPRLTQRQGSARPLRWAFTPPWRCRSASRSASPALFNVRLRP